MIQKTTSAGIAQKPMLAAVHSSQTAIQKIISQINEQPSFFDFWNWFDDNQEILLAKEKQQIIDAFTAGQIDIANMFLKEYKERGFDNELNKSAILNNDKEDGKQYYNNTFTNNDVSV